MRYEGRGEALLASFATIPTPIANRFGRATRRRDRVVYGPEEKVSGVNVLKGDVQNNDS